MFWTCCNFCVVSLGQSHIEHITSRLHYCNENMSNCEQQKGFSWYTSHTSSHSCHFLSSSSTGSRSTPRLCTWTFRGCATQSGINVSPLTRGETGFTNIVLSGLCQCITPHAVPHFLHILCMDRYITVQIWQYRSSICYLQMALVYIFTKTCLGHGNND